MTPLITGAAFKLSLIRCPDGVVRYEVTDGDCPTCGAICLRQNVNGRRADDTSYRHCTNPTCASMAQWLPGMALGPDHEKLIADALLDMTSKRQLSRDDRQAQIASWAAKAFGHAEATSLPQRGLRLLEEAIEAFQACAGDEAIAHKPPGTVGQELGGVAVTTLALAAAAGLSADAEECREIDRVLSKPLHEFTARNASKNAAGFLVAEVEP